MKRIYLFAILVLSMTSCNKWLDITPDNTILEGQLYKEGSGFQIVLNGIYKTIAQDGLYGREMTYGFVDALSQNYVRLSYAGIRPYHFYNDVAQFKYVENTLTKSCIDYIWRTSYAAIANCNNLLMNIEKSSPGDFKLGQMEKELIKGETLALRAMLHLDLLRLFGAAPMKNGGGIFIPYVTTSPYYGGQTPESTESVLRKITDDLKIAKDLIYPFDTYNENHRGALSSVSRFTWPNTLIGNSTFYNFRGYRMNYMAASAILARAYNYWGKHQEAYDLLESIKKFVTYTSNLGEDSYALSFTNGWNMKNDRKFTQDLIFCLSNTLLAQNYVSYSVSTSNENLLLNKDIVKFDDEGDYRKTYLTTSSSYGLSILKNVPIVNNSNDLTLVTVDMVPMIRLSELYFIEAEYHASKGDFVAAQSSINDVREGRNSVRKELGITDMESFKRELFVEVRKEFFQEGQIFFYYKKYNELLTKTMNQESFIIPTPESEKIN